MLVPIAVLSSMPRPTGMRASKRSFRSMGNAGQVKGVPVHAGLLGVYRFRPCAESLLGGRELNGGIGLTFLRYTSGQVVSSRQEAILIDIILPS